MKFLFFFLITVFSAQILPAQDSDFLLDERDGNIYLVVQFNDQWWMCQNLKFDAGEGSSCYEGDETNCMLKGRWYSWEAAQRACPEGYRLPGDEDWKALEIFIGMDKAELDKRYNRNSGTVGKFLKIDGGLGFDADFAGIVNPISDDAYFNTHAYFWTATEHDEINGWARVMEKTKVGIDRQIITKNYGLSVRCVKDAVAESPD
ncbi:MAG: hypothetical protein K8R63_04770 [Bacteroidales bacterium]|nr:hypothetical protein [Bacteroidales bacterium]